MTSKAVTSQELRKKKVKQQYQARLLFIFYI